MAVVNLTEARIRELPPGSGIWRDEQVKGLLVICHKSTRRSPHKATCGGTGATSERCG